MMVSRLVESCDQWRGASEANAYIADGMGRRLIGWIAAYLREAGAAPETEGNVIRSVAVGSRSDVDLKRIGPHILLSGMRKQLSPYDSFVMTLRFERAGKIEVEVMVEDASVLEPPHR